MATNTLKKCEIRGRFMRESTANKKYFKWVKNNKFNRLEEKEQRIVIKFIESLDENKNRIPKPFLSKILSGKIKLTYNALDRIVCYTDSEPPIDEPVPGIIGWSENATYCGENREDFKGCGTFYHAHKKDNLCAECYDNLGDSEFVSRDIRAGNEISVANTI